jgi:UrcA family protein
MFIKSIFAAALLLGIPVVAGAHEPFPASATVSAKGLDLSTDAGAREMLRRVDKAVETVCGAQPDMLQLARKRLWRACATQAQSQALATIGNARVAELAANPRRKTQIAAR